MELWNRKSLVVGMGRSGLDAARFLKLRGASVTVSDQVPESQASDGAGILREMGIHLEFGGHNPDSFTQADLIVISPGVPHTIAAIQAAREKGVPVLGEIELASRFISEPIVAVTGTNGKTTTTRLLGDMLARSGSNVFVGGNIGTPLISYLLADEQADWLVIEISSFQLDTITSFKPDIGLLLNISDDHLDRYDNFEAYARSKGRLLENQGPGDVAILNGTDNWVRRVSQGVPATKYYFTGRDQSEIGADIESDAIRFKGLDMLDRKQTRKSISTPVPLDHQAAISLQAVPLTCPHELENIAAAGLATFACGGNLKGIQHALQEFKGLPHRLELVANIDGIAFYNDSKATNVDAVLRALECLPEPIHLIMCGRDKGGNFKLLTRAVRQKVKSLTLWGEAAANIAEVLGDSAPTQLAASMEDAVALAFGSADSGELVLLSPGCTSFDRYENYKERGQAFCKAVTQGNLG